MLLIMSTGVGHKKDVCFVLFSLPALFVCLRRSFYNSYLFNIPGWNTPSETHAFSAIYGGYPRHSIYNGCRGQLCLGGSSQLVVRINPIYEPWPHNLAEGTYDHHDDYWELLENQSSTPINLIPLHCKGEQPDKNETHHHCYENPRHPSLGGPSSRDWTPQVSSPFDFWNFARKRSVCF